MKKKTHSKVPYTMWTDEEQALLVHFIKTAQKQGKTVLEACKFASKKLGRSVAACQTKYHTELKVTLPSVALSKPASGEKKSSEQLVRVMYHNGVSKEAEVLVNTDQYIVAKCGDAVITIDKV